MRHPSRSRRPRPLPVPFRRPLVQAIFALEPVERRVLMASVAGTFYQDLDGNGTRDAGEAGLPNWSVFLDENQNGTFDGTSDVVPTADPNQPILDVRPPQLY